MKQVQVELGTIPANLMRFKSFKTNKDASLKCLKPTNMYHNFGPVSIVATVHQSQQHHMAYYTNEMVMTAVTPRHGTYHSDSVESTSR